MTKDKIKRSTLNVLQSLLSVGVPLAEAYRILGIHSESSHKGLELNKLNRLRRIFFQDQGIQIKT